MWAIILIFMEEHMHLPSKMRVINKVLRKQKKEKGKHKRQY